MKINQCLRLAITGSRTRQIEKLLFGAFLTILPAMIPVTATSAETSYKTEYAISVFGMTIARSHMTTKISDAAYSLNADFNSSGIARIFDKTKGTINITGTINGQGVNARVVPSSYNTTYRSGKKHKQTTIQFQNGSVTSYKNQPEINKVAPWVELKDSDLKAVLDPVSAMIITSPSPQAVCNRTLEVFDGQTRAQIRLTPAGTQPYTTTGFSGTAQLCNAKFIPVAGYEKDKKSLRYLADQSKITISFASLNTDSNGAGIYAPVTASVGTKIGTVSVRATRFEIAR